MKTLTLLAILVSGIVWGQSSIDENHKKTLQKLKEYSKYKEDNTFRENFIGFWSNYKRRGEFEELEEYNYRMSSEKVTEIINKYIVNYLGVYDYNYYNGELDVYLRESVRPVYTINNEIYDADSKIYIIEFADRRNNIDILFVAQMEMDEAKSFRNSDFRENSMVNAFSYNLGDMINLANNNIYAPVRMKYRYNGETKDFLMMLHLYQDYYKSVDLRFITKIVPQYDSGKASEQFVYSKKGYVEFISWNRVF